MNGDSLPLSFIDTNILVYAVADDDPGKRREAHGLVDVLAKEGALRTSTQVLQELYVVLTRKVKRKLSPKDALEYLDRLAKAPVIATDYSLVRDAAVLSDRHAISLWDALIIAAAARAGAEQLYSEDLQHGRTILGVKIINPFRKH